MQDSYSICSIVIALKAFKMLFACTTSITYLKMICRIFHEAETCCNIVESIIAFKNSISYSNLLTFNVIDFSIYKSASKLIFTIQIILIISWLMSLPPLTIVAMIAPKPRINRRFCIPNGFVDKYWNTASWVKICWSNDYKKTRILRLLVPLCIISLVPIQVNCES